MPGTVTLDGNLADWSVGDQIDTTNSVANYDIYGKLTGGSYVFALKAPVAIGAATTVWLNTDQNANTGYKIWGFAGGAEYNINFDASGTPRLYTGDAGQTPVPGATVTFAYSADKKIVEFAVPTSAIGSPAAINTLWDVNDTTFLPTDFSAAQYTVSGAAAPTGPVRTDFTKKVGILYSDTSANQYFDKMAYSQLFMAAQNQATMAGVRFEVLTEADLTNLAKLVNYDALLFPSFSHVQSGQAAAIESTLKTASQQYGVGLIASGEFMTYNQTGGALGADPYARMKSLLGLDISGGGFPADVVIRAGDVTHSMMNDYAANEVIHNYDDVGWLTFTPTGTGARVLATQTVGGQTHNAVVATTTGGRNVHFSTEEVMADNNLLWQAIDYSVNGAGVTAGLQLSRQSSIVASRVDMDQAMEMFDVNPAGGAQGIYDKLLPILQQWKTQYNYVGSYYVDIGNNPAEEQGTDWSVSGPYYKALIDMGNELGSHSFTHPHNTNALTAAQIQSEFQGSKQTIQQQMSSILGRAFTVDGAAVPGDPESLATALSILQYYNYISGGFSGVGAGYPGAFGYLNPAMAASNKVYLAPNVIFDFSLVEFQGMTPAQAAAEWQREWTELTAHGDVPVLVWPWHDYGAAAWQTNPPAASPYNVSMYTDFISKAHSRGAEFVTLDDLAERISSFAQSGVRTTVSGNTVTATGTSASAGKLALDLDNLGTQKIASVTNWYAYDDDSVFLPRAGGTYTINLGTSVSDVTHIISLPMRAELLSVSGNGTNLSFSVIGEGRVVVDLVAPAGRQVNVAGATVVSLVGDKLTLDLGSAAQDNVSITLSAAGPANQAPTFAVGDGLATATFGVLESGEGLVVQPDGGIVIAGMAFLNADRDFALVRINSGGTLDTSFDGDGRLTTHFGAQDTANAIVRQADGKLVVAGLTDNFAGAADFAVARYNANGTLDTTFSGDGRVTTNIVANDEAYGVALQADGKIVVVGNRDDFTVVRYNANGTLDTTFDGDGWVRTDFGGGSADWAVDAAVQADGKIVVAGRSNNAFALARYNANGTLDATFSGDGKVTTALAPSGPVVDLDFVRDMVLQPDGKILVVGTSFHGGTHSDVAVLRYNSNGSLDTTFGGGDGIVFTDIGGGLYDYGNAIALQSDGKIIVAGSTESGFDRTDFLLVRYNADGSLERANVFDIESRDGFGSVAVQADGKIVAGTGFSAVRFNADLSLDSTFDPVKINMLNGAPTYTGGGAAVVLDGDVRVYDANLATAGNYGGATLTLARNGGANAQDIFSATGSLAALTPGAALRYEGVTVGTVTTNSGGRLVLTFNSAATQWYMDGVLQSIAYSSSNANPTGTARIDWVFSDGNTGSQGTGGALAASGSTTVTFNRAPTITSNGGGATGAISIAENATAVTTVTATDPNGQTITYSISGGADAAKFTIDAQTGALRFITAPDFENRTDQGANNVYDVVVRAADSAGGEDTQALAVTVTNVAGQTINGTDAANTLTGGVEEDTISGLGGNDVLRGVGGNDTLLGAGGGDTLNGGLGADVLDGGAGFDYASYETAAAGVTANLAGAGSGEAAGDTFIAVEGLIGSSFNDQLLGDVGANSLHGRDGNDTLRGAGGTDTLYGGLGADSLDGGADFDYASYETAAAGVTASLAGAGSGEAAGDTYIAVEGLIGSSFNDQLNGDGATNTLQGRDGNDTLRGGGGRDTLFGGLGADALHGDADFDYASYETAAAGVTADLSGVVAGAGEAAGDTFTSMEGLIGSAFGDQLYGNGIDNNLHGLGGDDVIVGGAGSDTLRGGRGADRLTGGTGADRFVFNSVDDRLDTIVDFQRGAGGDALDIREVLTGYASGSSNPASFVRLTQSGADTILAVNTDGAGTDFVDLARLQNNTGLVLNDLIANGNLLLS